MAKISLNLADEAVAIAQLVGVNVDEIKDKSDVRLVLAAEVATQYALIDEILAEIIVRYFFDTEPDVLHFEKAWKTEKFKIFVHHILDEMVLLKKLSMVRAIGPVPNEVSRIIDRINAVRNGIARSFFPENSKENRATGKVLDASADIRSLDGLRQFKDDADTAYRYLHDRLYGSARRAH
jgi:hypothetical protein